MTWTRTVLPALILAALVPVPAHARHGAAECESARQAAQAQIDTACPCDGARAHGSYVRCVNKKIRDLAACKPGPDGTRSCGPIPRMCTGRMRRQASRSACGKPAAMVACCVPRQRDCVGDAHPGDGQADGTCSGTTRKCDQVSDCVIPKCEMAASADRCQLVGGTPGVSRDCAVACGQ